MAGATPILGLPYPTGTDRVADGDNAMQALAERIEHRLARGMLARAFAVANQGPFGGMALINGLSVAVNLPAGRYVRVSVYLANVFGNAGSAAVATIYDGAQQIQQGAAFIGNGSVGLALGLSTTHTPSAGSHTYQARMASALGSVTNGAGTDYPSLLVIEDLGPVAP